MSKSAEELEQIYLKLRPGVLLVPITQVNASSPSVGPKFMVFRLYSELGVEPSNSELAYWEALQEADVVDGIGEMSWINANLSEARATDVQIHRDMVGRFISPNLLSRIVNKELQEAVSVVFNRIGCLLTMRHLILFGGNNRQQWDAYKVGRLALLANDFVQNTLTPTTPSNLDLLLLMTPTWDVYNSRNLGHAMSRMFTILRKSCRAMILRSRSWLHSSDFL